MSERMSKYDHREDDPHVTKTFGTSITGIQVVTMVFRVRPHRLRDIDQDEQQRLIGVLYRWAERWLERRHMSAPEPAVSRVGNQGNPDALAMSFWAFGPLPADWLCFSSMVYRPIDNDTPTMVPVFAGFGIFGGPDERPSGDDVEVELESGRKVRFGRQDKQTH